jgi:hypothetical protein
MPALKQARKQSEIHAGRISPHERGKNAKIIANQKSAESVLLIARSSTHNIQLHQLQDGGNRIHFFNIKVKQK